MSNEQPIDGLEAMTPKQQRHFRRSRRMLTRFPQTPRLLCRAHRTIFRLTAGGLGGTMQGTPIGLLTTTGRRSGQTRTVPIGYTDDGPPGSSQRRIPHPRWRRARRGPRAD